MMKNIKYNFKGTKDLFCIRLDDATFEDEVVDPELAVEDELVLEAVEDDDIKSDDAAKGQSVRPEAASLELASLGTDVNQFGAGLIAEGGGWWRGSGE
ncbi:unnamed protein product [Malus baccata var. baccata]